MQPVAINIPLDKILEQVLKKKAENDNVSLDEFSRTIDKIEQLTNKKKA